MSYSAIGKVVKIFDEHGLYHIDISDDQIWYWSIKISENLSIFFLKKKFWRSSEKLKILHFFVLEAREERKYELS